MTSATLASSRALSRSGRAGARVEARAFWLHVELPVHVTQRLLIM